MTARAITNGSALFTGRPTRSATQPQGASGLVRARELDGFTLDGAIRDVRGWPVCSCDAVRVGTVDSFYVDIHARQVRYIGVKLEPPHGPDGGEDPDSRPRLAGCVLVPVGAARRVDASGFVVLDTLSATRLADAPRLARRAVTRADEVATLSAYQISSSRDMPMMDLYCGPAFDGRSLLALDTGD